MLIRLILVLLIPLAAIAQDTTRLVPIARVAGSKLLFHDATNLVMTASTENGGYPGYDSILTYDITEPYRPALISRLMGIHGEAGGGGPFGGISSFHYGATLYEDLVVSSISYHGSSGDVAPVTWTYGPVRLRGESLDHAIRWDILVHEEIAYNSDSDFVMEYFDPGDILTNGTYLYLAAGSAGLRTYDLSDKSHPAQTDTVGCIVDDLALNGNRLIAWTWREMSVLDVSDPAHPTQTWHYGRDEMPYTPLAFSAGYFYAWNRIADSTAFIVLDVTGDGEPVEVGRFAIKEVYHDMRYDQFIIEDGKLYARYNDLITVYSLADPLHPIFEKLVYLPLGNDMLAVAGRLLIEQDEGSPEDQFPDAILYDVLENGVTEPTVLPPNVLALRSSFPNPFNSSTTISYDIARPGFVRLGVYDAGGRLVGTLKEGYAGAGRYSSVWNGGEVGSGTYFLNLEAGGVKAVQPIVLVR